MPAKKIVKTRNAAATPPKGVRERLLDTADRLFYKEGVRAVGREPPPRDAGRQDDGVRRDLAAVGEPDDPPVAA